MTRRGSARRTFDAALASSTDDCILGDPCNPDTCGYSGSTPQAPTVDSDELGPWCCYADEVGVYAEGVCTADDPRHAPTHCGYDNVRRGLVPAPTVDSDELARLRQWKAEATAVLDQWDRLHIALGSPGRLGESKAVASLAEIQRRIVAAAGVSSDRP